MRLFNYLIAAICIFPAQQAAGGTIGSAVKYDSIFVYGSGSLDEVYDLTLQLASGEQANEDAIRLKNYSKFYFKQPDMTPLKQQAVFTVSHLNQTILQIDFIDQDNEISVVAPAGCTRIDDRYTAYPYAHQPTFVRSCSLRVRCPSSIGHLDINFYSWVKPDCLIKTFAKELRVRKEDAARITKP